MDSESHTAAAPLMSLCRCALCPHWDPDTFCSSQNEYLREKFGSRGHQMLKSQSNHFPYWNRRMARKNPDYKYVSWARGHGEATLVPLCPRLRAAVFPPRGFSSLWDVLPAQQPFLPHPGPPPSRLWSPLTSFSSMPIGLPRIPA